MPPPDRWMDYCSMGNVIPGTKFIAFKVPLKGALLHNVEDEDRFSPTILIDQLGEKNLTLAGVIDLTFTLKYYNKQEFLSKAIGHKKVFTKGHEVPTDEVYREFTEAVESFNNDEKLIGVHCTHGVNRTGYLICRYMIEKMNKNPQEAIDLFNTARGHNIERENYLDDLKRRRSGEPSLECSQEQSKKKKPRWRHHKEDHPNWRQKNNDHPNWHQGNENQSNWRQRNADCPDWRHRDEGHHNWSQRNKDHPNWRQKNNWPQEGNSFLPPNGQKRHSDVFQSQQNPRFAAPYNSRNRGTCHNGNDSNYNPLPYSHGGRGFNRWHDQQGQDSSFHYGQHNGHHHHRPGGHWDSSGYQNDELYNNAGGYPRRRIPRHN